MPLVDELLHFPKCLPKDLRKKVDEQSPAADYVEYDPQGHGVGSLISAELNYKGDTMDPVDQNYRELDGGAVRTSRGGTIQVLAEQPRAGGSWGSEKGKGKKDKKGKDGGKDNLCKECGKRCEHGARRSMCRKCRFPLSSIRRISTSLCG